MTLRYTRMRFEMAVADGIPLQPERPPVNRLTGVMHPATFNELLLNLPALRLLTMVGAGEPLLVPSLEAMVGQASHRNMLTTLVTNGTLLYRDRAEGLIEAGLHRLRVLTDGDLSNYDDVGPQVNFGPMLENLAGLMAARRAAGEGPAVQVVLIVTPQNMLQIPDIAALLGGLWVDEVHLRHAAGPDQDPDLLAKVIAEARMAAKDYGLVLHSGRSLKDPERMMTHAGELWRP